MKMTPRMSIIEFFLEHVFYAFKSKKILIFNSNIYAKRNCIIRTIYTTKFLLTQRQYQINTFFKKNPSFV